MKRLDEPAHNRWTERLWGLFCLLIWLAVLLALVAAGMGDVPR